MEVEQGTLEILLSVDVRVKAVKCSLRSNDNVVWNTFGFKGVQRRAVLIVEDIFRLILCGHGCSISQFAEIILESLRPFIVTVIGEDVVEIEVTVRTVKTDLASIQDST